MKTKRRYINLTIPTIRKYRDAVDNGGLMEYFINMCEKAGAGSVSVKYSLKNRPYRITIKAKRLCR